MSYQGRKCGALLEAERKEVGAFLTCSSSGRHHRYRILCLQRSRNKILPCPFQLEQKPRCNLTWVTIWSHPPTQAGVRPREQVGAACLDATCTLIFGCELPDLRYNCTTRGPGYSHKPQPHGYFFS